MKEKRRYFIVIRPKKICRGNEIEYVVLFHNNVVKIVMKDKRAIRRNAVDKNSLFYLIQKGYYREVKERELALVL